MTYQRLFLVCHFLFIAEQTHGNIESSLHMDLFIFIFRFTHVYTPFFSLGNVSLQTLKVLVGLLTHSSHLFIINHIENSTWTCVDMEFIFGCLLQIDEWKKGTTIHAKKSLSAWAIRLKIKKKKF